MIPFTVINIKEQAKKSFQKYLIYMIPYNLLETKGNKQKEYNHSITPKLRIINIKKFNIFFTVYKN